MKTKQCTKCSKQKLLSEFNKVKDGKHGVRGDCRECSKKYYQIHKIEIAEHMRKYRQTDKGRQFHNQNAKKHKQTIVGYLRCLFQAIKYRCNNPNNPRYKDWGGRGIKCRFKNADEFINYVINRLQIDPHGLTIDRIDNDGHYEPGNIRFVTRSENNKNKTRKEPK